MLRQLENKNVNLNKAPIRKRDEIAMLIYVHNNLLIRNLQMQLFKMNAK